VPVGAASFEQADLVFGDMKTNWRESVHLSPLADVFDTEILLKDRPGKAFRVAAVRGTNDGLRPTCYICDEVHELVDPQKAGAHLVIANGCAKRDQSLQLNITTAGHDLDTLLGRKYLRGKQIAAGDLEDDTFLMVWYEASDAWNLDDPEQLEQAIKDAYPADADFVPMDDIARRYGQIPEFEWRRYYANQWTRSDESWLPAGAWQACLEPRLTLSAGTKVWAAVDMALYHDHAAVAVVWQLDDGRWGIKASVWTPGDDGIDVANIMQHVRGLATEFELVECAYDPKFFDYPASVLADEGVPMLEHPQSAERMIPACGYAYEQIVSKQVTHDGDPVLEDHVLSAVQRPSETGWRLSKSRSSRKIDACIAMVIALARAGWHVNRPAPSGPNIW
ncbi:MAG: hypothetical protein KY462_17005, partial [Actinobacteria bacterium]|nr:hypothetical protein [Actinomycetota bacterium]